MTTVDLLTWNPQPSLLMLVSLSVVVTILPFLALLETQSPSALAPPSTNCHGLLVLPQLALPKNAPVVNNKESVTTKPPLVFTMPMDLPTST